MRGSGTTLQACPWTKTVQLLGNLGTVVTWVATTGPSLKGANPTANLHRQEGIIIPLACLKLYPKWPMSFPTCFHYPNCCDHSQSVGYDTISIISNDCIDSSLHLHQWQYSTVCLQHGQMIIHYTEGCLTWRSLNTVTRMWPFLKRNPLRMSSEVSLKGQEEMQY